jgi:hypothetical protein
MELVFHTSIAVLVLHGKTSVWETRQVLEYAGILEPMPVCQRGQKPLSVAEAPCDPQIHPPEKIMVGLLLSRVCMALRRREDHARRPRGRDER